MRLPLPDRPREGPKPLGRLNWPARSRRWRCRCGEETHTRGTGMRLGRRGAPLAVQWGAWAGLIVRVYPTAFEAYLWLRVVVRRWMPVTRGPRRGTRARDPNRQVPIAARLICTRACQDKLLHSFYCYCASCPEKE